MNWLVFIMPVIRRNRGFGYFFAASWMHVSEMHKKLVTCIDVQMQWQMRAWPARYGDRIWYLRDWFPIGCDGSMR